MPRLVSRVSLAPDHSSCATPGHNSAPHIKGSISFATFIHRHVGMDWQDAALALAGVIGSGVAVVHGILIQRLMVRPFYEFSIADRRISAPIRRLRSEERRVGRRCESSGASR